VALNAEVDSVPITGLLPLQPFVAVHAVAFALDQLKVDEEPAAIDDGVAVIVTDGTGAGVTAMVTELGTVPPEPVHDKL
jgi:hypothetical protein